MNNAEVVRRFETEFKDKGKLDAVDEFMAEDFVHHLPYPGVPEGRQGIRAIGVIVTSAFRDIAVSVDLVVAEGDLVADRISATGIRNDTGEPDAWVENHIYKVIDGRITELWPAGGPLL